MALNKRVLMLAATIMSFGLLDGCQNTPLNRLERKHMQLTQFQDGSEVFFVLRDQQIIAAQKNTPDNFYIKGIVENKEFAPKSEILGVGELATSGRSGWLELSTGQFHPSESGRKAVTPFVKGFMNDAEFIPSARTVFTEPK